jgi:uncharacterized protein (DUF2147 family)
LRREIASLNHRIVERGILRHQCRQIDSVDGAKWRLVIVQLSKFLMAGLVALVAAVSSAATAEPSVVGLWQKVDEETGKPVIWFLFVERNGTYQGVIARLFPRPNEPPNPTCANCQDDRRNAPLLGLPLIRGMKQDGATYQNGNILDPRDGSVYNAMMTVSPDGQTLTVRGYLGIALFGRDEDWHRLPDGAYKQLDPVIVSHYLGGHLPGGAANAPVRRPPQNTARSGNPLH